MNITREEIMHLANLAHLNIEENEIDEYRENLADILNFAEVVNKAPVDKLEITFGANEIVNNFRKDEVETFEDTEALLQNAPQKNQGMFEIPKVIN